MAEYAARIFLVGFVATVLAVIVGLIAPGAYRAYRQIQCVETTGDVRDCREHIK